MSSSVNRGNKMTRVERWIVNDLDKCKCPGDHLFRYHPIKFPVLWFMGFSMALEPNDILAFFKRETR